MMNANLPNILTVNAGSSSVKFSLYEKDTLDPILKGVIDRIGMEDTFVSIENKISGYTSKTGASGDAATILIEALTERELMNSIAGIGHRVVHGGGKYHEPMLLREEVISDLESIIGFAPRHLPTEIALIRRLIQLLPDIPQIACFDTAFHHALPQNAQTIPLPAPYRNAGVRKYGFHGLSYEYLLHVLEETHDVHLKDKRIILAHLGGGASLTAVMNGNSVDTTMGFTPNSGIPMSTRTGDVDAGLFEYFTNTVGMTAEAFNHMVNYESGVLAVSGETADMEVLIQEAQTNPQAENAVSYFAYHVRKQIGALAAVMGGIDILVFTGGIGQNAPIMRERIVRDLGFLGLHLNEGANKQNEGLISNDDSSVSVYCISANEELIIAKHVTSVLHGL